MAYIKLNFGGFVPISTVDWRGRSACVVFLRGCPIRCFYCHNEGIISGEDYRDIDEIKEMIKSSSQFISGVVFSGGEPTKQREVLLELARYAKKINLGVGIQTNGLFPDTLNQLIEERLVDRVALDFKSRFEGYSETTGELTFENCERNVKESFSLCKNAYEKNILGEFEVVITIFYESDKYIQKISNMIGNIPLVLQQGEYRIPHLTMMPINVTKNQYWTKKRRLQEEYRPPTLDEIKKIAETLERKIRIRTRETGEIHLDTRKHP